MTDMKDRLKEVYEYVRRNYDVHTQKDFAATIGMSRPAMSSAMNGDGRYLTKNLFQKICSTFPGIFNLDYLLTGDGQLLTKADPESQQDALDYASNQVAMMASRLSDAIARIEAREKHLDEKEAQLIALTQKVERTLSMLLKILPSDFPASEAFIGSIDMAAEDQPAYDTPTDNP